MKSLKKNRDSIEGIRKSLLSFGKGITSATSISFGISKDLVRGNTAKKNAIFTKSRLFNKRRQSVLRRESEDIIEGEVNTKNLTSKKYFNIDIFDALGLEWRLFSLKI